MSDYPDTYWHCRVTKNNQNKYSSEIDLTFAELQAKIIRPFRGNERFQVGGQVVSADSVDEILLVWTPHPDSAYRQWYGERQQRDNATSNIIFIGVYPGPFQEEDAENRTEELLFLPSTAPPRIRSASDGQISGNTVFVVHGRDEGLRDTVCRLLEKLSLETIVLHEQPDRARTVIEKFEDHSDVGFAIVLLTPDDVGRLCEEQELPLSPRARQNVIFELGYFFAKLGRKRVCALLKKDVEFPSDIAGVIYKQVESGGSWRRELAKELKAAGLPVDLNKLS